MQKKVQIHFIVFLTRAIARLNCQVPTLKEMMGNEIILCFYASVLIAEQKMKKKNNLKLKSNWVHAHIVKFYLRQYFRDHKKNFSQLTESDDDYLYFCA